MAPVSVLARRRLAVAALLACAAAAAAAPARRRRDACTPLGERCAGAYGMPEVPWLGCCDDAVCEQHPDYAADPAAHWGRFCVAAPPPAEPGYDQQYGQYEQDAADAAPSVVTPNNGGGDDMADDADDTVDDSADDTADDTADNASNNTSDSGNPLEGVPMYVNPSFQRDIGVSYESAAAGAEKDNLKVMRDVASAYWLDFKYKAKAGNDSSTDSAAGILKDAAAKSPAPLVSLIVYDLPNRDCHAKASNGEICCSSKKNPDGTCNYLDNDGDCADGLADYKANYIDEIAVSVAKYCDSVPMALFIEPDSLPNLVTNTDDPKCGGSATQASYRKGITYAVTTLAKACPAATIYVDGAHGGWLGWPDNLSKFSEEIKGLGVSQYIRGFSLNVANYQPLGAKCPSVGHCLDGQNADDPCCTDPCGLAGEYNLAHNELNYAAALNAAMKEAMPEFDARMVIDTGRNGKNPRKQCSNWCNVRNAGSGGIPTTKTGFPEVVDAYMWLKTPGESDGCTEDLPGGGKCPRFDADCASVDSIGTDDGEPRAPEAGGWFDYQIKMLARNADFDHY